MTRQQCEDSLKAAAGGAQLISRRELASKFWGQSETSNPVMESIKGIPKIGTKYSIVDLSYRIHEMQKGGG